MFPMLVPRATVYQQFLIDRPSSEPQRRYLYLHQAISELYRNKTFNKKELVSGLGSSIEASRISSVSRPAFLTPPRNLTIARCSYTKRQRNIEISGKKYNLHPWKPLNGFKWGNLARERVECLSNENYSPPPPSHGFVLTSHVNCVL